MRNKGQFFLAGILLVGLVLVTMAINLQDPELEDAESLEIIEEVETSVPTQVSRISAGSGGEEFMDKFQAFTQRQRNLAGFQTPEIGYTVIYAESQGSDLKVKVGRFGEGTDSVDVEIDGEQMSEDLSPQDRENEEFEADSEYDIEIDSEVLSEEFVTESQRWVVVSYEIEEDAERAVGSYNSEGD